MSTRSVSLSVKRLSLCLESEMPVMLTECYEGQKQSNSSCNAEEAQQRLNNGESLFKGRHLRGAGPVTQVSCPILLSLVWRGTGRGSTRHKLATERMQSLGRFLLVSFSNDRTLLVDLEPREFDAPRPVFSRSSLTRAHQANLHMPSGAHCEAPC